MEENKNGKSTILKSQNLPRRAPTNYRDLYSHTLPISVVHSLVTTQIFIFPNIISKTNKTQLSFPTKKKTTTFRIKWERHNSRFSKTPGCGGVGRHMQFVPPATISLVLFCFPWHSSQQAHQQHILNSCFFMYLLGL